MAEEVGTIRVLILTIAPGAGTPPATGDDSGPNRAAPEPFRAVADGQDPNREATKAFRAAADRQDPNREATKAFRAAADGQDPNREPLPDGQDPNRGQNEPSRALADGQDPNREPDPHEGSRGPSDARDTRDTRDTRDALDALDALGAPDTRDARDMQLLDHVWRIAQGASRHCDGVMKVMYEYSLPQILVLRAIIAGEQAGRPALCAREVAHELQCSRANATEIVAALVRMHTLTKRRDPANQRIVRLYPTPKGRLAEFHARAQLADDASRAFATLEGPDKATLLALLQKVASLP
ncbi:MAG: Winged helix DNA-binding domain [Myxococcaceae bacterium]|nr:Winged helix DNA-binding domain [Myxococcaceae bacterium]